MLNTIEISRIFKTETPAGQQALRAATLLSLAIASIVPVPTQQMETSANYQGYFLENASPLQGVIDEIREVHLLSSDDVLRGAYSLWIARFVMYHNTSADAMLQAGNRYNRALEGLVPNGVKFSDLDITDDVLQKVIDFVRKNSGMDAAAATVEE